MTPTSLPGPTGCLPTPGCRQGTAAVAQAILLLLLAAGTSGCGSGGGGPPPAPPVEVEVIEVGVAPVDDRLSAIGTLRADEEVTIMAEAAGRIRAIHFTEGQRIEAGALLFELDETKERAQRDQAKADLDLARQNAERVEMLAGTRAISKQEIDQTRSQVALKEAIVAFQEQRLAEMQIIAPFAGVLGPRSVSPGQFVTVGQPLVTLTDDRRVKVQYELPERHLAELRQDQAVALRVAAFADRVFPGVVELINPRINEGTRTVAVRALVENPERLLRPGMFARVETITGTRPAAVVIPERAIVPSLDGFAVYVATNGVARLTPIGLGGRLPGAAEVRQGLSAGQVIVVGGIQKIVDGSAIVPERVGARTEPSPDGVMQPSTGS